MTSALRGDGGSDTLIARAGPTVMSVGTGTDRFEAAGMTIVSLPMEDSERGETLDCNLADLVLVDSKLSLTQLEAAELTLENCVDFGCNDDHGEGGNPEDPFDCHEK